MCFLASPTAISLFHHAIATQAAPGLAGSRLPVPQPAAALWATHFIAMRHEPGVPMAYNVGLTALSLTAAAFVTAMGLAVAVYLPWRWGAAIGGDCGWRHCMHALFGMSALNCRARSPGSYLVLISCYRVLFGMAALALAIRREVRGTTIAAVLLTLAIVSHHFTAMGAVEVIPDPARIIHALTLSPSSLALAIAGAAFAVLGLTLAGAFVDGRLRKQNLSLAAALNNMSPGLCMYDGDERLTVCNERYIEMYGLSKDVVKPGCISRYSQSPRRARQSLDRRRGLPDKLA